MHSSFNKMQGAVKKSIWICSLSIKKTQIDVITEAQKDFLKLKDKSDRIFTATTGSDWW